MRLKEIDKSMAGTFEQKVEQIILEHINDEKFGVSELAAELNLSRSQIHRSFTITFRIDIRINQQLKIAMQGSS